MAAEKCAWGDLFDDDQKNSLEKGFFYTGVLSVALTVWLNLTILMTNLRLDHSYKNLANFMVAACVYRVVAMIPFANRILRSDEFLPYCTLFAFLETFLAVLEVEWLTHVCIERYVITKFVVKGLNINKGHYTLFNRLCIFFACLYSIPPLFGVGRYGFDFSCTFYTFDMILPDFWMQYVVLAIFFLRSIKPTAVIMITLVRACVFEKNLKNTQEDQKRRNFTRNVFIVAFVNLLCWTPLALIRGSVLMSQLFYSEALVMNTALYIKWAMWMNWVSPALTTATLFLADSDIRNKMLFNINGSYADKSSIDDKEQKEK